MLKNILLETILFNLEKDLKIKKYYYKLLLEII